MNSNSLGYDILQEIFNIGVGKAASMLSEIVNKTIILDIPNIVVLCTEKQNKDVKEYTSKLPKGALMVSSIKFGKEIAGQANLIFPANKMRMFLNLCMDQEGNITEDYLNFSDMDFDIIKEVGNIILNSLVGEIGNFLDINLKYSLPEVKLFDRIVFKDSLENGKAPCVLMLYITFIIDDIEIEGAIIINLTLNSINELMKIIKKMEDDINEKNIT